MSAKGLTTTERRERYEALVHEAEALIESDPQRYRRKVGAFAMLGFVVIFGMLFTLIALVGGTIWAAMVSSTGSVRTGRQRCAAAVDQTRAVEAVENRCDGERAECESADDGGRLHRQLGRDHRR